ncbi:uncharacterized protein [Henckelia pumila]|uniref:uncharacterized protein n=1 Tax=Henckelia pumila TaxID=405737 RepID=UPI003C6DD286
MGLGPQSRRPDEPEAEGCTQSITGGLTLDLSAYSGFVAGRLISDNILLAQEMVHHLDHPIRGGNVIMKLDMDNAYDRVQYFQSQRGIRKKDPLSPLLFIIAVEYLSRGLDSLFERNKSLQFRTGRPFRLSHLGYADEIILFSNGSIPGIRLIQDFFITISSVPVLQPPGTILHRFEMLCDNFLWGSNLGRRSIHWISWAKICLPTTEGGLRIQRFKDMVTSFSIKLWVQFCMVDSLCRDFLLLKYCWTDFPAAVKLVKNMSSFWWRMLKVRSRAEPEIGWRIGDGNVSFWFDSWVLDGPLSASLQVQGQSSKLFSWYLTDRAWNLDRLLLVVLQEVALRILEVPIHPSSKYFAIWKLSITGRVLC